VGVVSWSAKADPPAAGFQREYGGKYPAPLDSGVEGIFPEVQSHFILLASRTGFRGGCAAFDLRKGKPVALIEDREFTRGHGPIAISPDGAYVVDCEFMGSDLRVWSFNDRAICKRIPRHGGSSLRAAFFLDPTRLLIASGSFDLQMEVLSVETGQTLLAFSATDKRLKSLSSTAIAVSPGGRQMAVIQEQSLHIFDLQEGREVGRSNLPPFSEHGTMTWTGIAFRSDGGQLAAVGYGTWRFRVACWDMNTGKTVTDYVSDLPDGSGTSAARQSDSGKSLAWLPGTNLLVVAGTELIDAETGRPLAQLPGTSPSDVLAIDSRRFLAVQTGSMHQQGVMTVVTVPAEEEIARLRQAGRPGGATEAARLPILSAANFSKASQRRVPVTPVPWTATFAGHRTPENLLARPISAGKPGLELRSMIFNKSTPPTLAMVHGTAKATESPAAPFSRPRQTQGASSPTSWFEMFDLAAGTRSAGFDLPGSYDVLGLSTDGTLAVLGLEVAESQASASLLAQHRAFDHPAIGQEEGYERLDIWSLQTGKHALGFQPYVDKSEPEERLVTWCTFLDKRHILTTNRAGLLVKWELPSCQAEYALEEFGRVTAMSSDRRYVIGWMPGTDVLRVVDTQSGDCNGELHVGERIWAVEAAAISACGQQFAAIVWAASRRLTTWDLGSGVIARDMVFSEEICPNRPSLIWVDPSYVIVGGRYLLDLERSITAWQYTLDQGVVASDSCDNRLWYLVPESRGAVYRLEALRVPVDDVRAKTANLELADQVTFRPGVPVSLSVQVTVSGVDNAARIITDALRSQGIPVEASAQLVFEYRANEKSTGRTTEYRPLHESSSGRPPAATVNEKAIEINARLAYRDGLELWKTKHVISRWTPMFVRGDPQPEYENALRTEFASSLSAFRMPPYVFLPPEKLGAGVSRLDAH
jgi:hypothetical protein